MVVLRSVSPTSSDVLHSYLENSIPNSLDARTMSHVGIANSLVPISLLGLFFMFFVPGLVGGQGLLPGVQQPDPASTLKEYTGVRVKSDSLRQVYYHDQTIAVVELGPGKELLNCELVEVYTNAELALEKHNYSSIAKPILITFKEIQDLMLKCQELAPPAGLAPPFISTPETVTSRAGQPRNPMSLFSGIMPGTKWCGTGDIAKSYFDMGEANDLDKCCRSHDLCPAKVRAFNSRYNLTNYSLYTKSHCLCDSAFYNCLKATKNPTASLMGNIYFNIVRIPCVEDAGCEGTTCERKKRFRVSRKHY